MRERNQIPPEEAGGSIFDPDHPAEYSLLTLPDLAAIRVLVFPRARLLACDEILRSSFPEWAPDPILDDKGTTLAYKYTGFCPEVSDMVRAEYQVVPLLIGLFWEVEHSTMYKPHPSLKGVGGDSDMRGLRNEVEKALSRFEAGFEGFVQNRE